jgi:hypothetical protein
MKNFLSKGIVTFVICSLVLGQGSRMGTASSTQLQIAQGAQYLSGGGAASNATGIEAAYWNPAGLSMSGNKVDAIFSYRSYIADIGNNFFGVATDFGKIGKIGISARTFSIGDINETTVFYPDGTGQVFTPTFMVLGGTISKRLTDRTSVGFNANWVSEGFGRVSANALTFDVGVQYQSLMDIEGLNVGFVIRNFGSPVTYGGEGLGVSADIPDANRPVEYYKVDAASFDLPFTMDMSATYALAGINLGVTYTSNYYATDEVSLLGSYSIGDLAAVRAGYKLSLAAKEINTAESNWDYKNPFDGISFGGSLNLKSFIGMNMSVDYAFIPTEYFSANQVLALRFGF